MAKALVNGIEINYVSTGQGPVIVLIHGHPFEHTMWYPQVVSLSDNYHVITPDLRGFGKSGLSEYLTNFEDYAADMLLLMDYLKIGDFHLCGLSMGGQIIMEMVRQAPSRIRSLIFADTFAGLDSEEAKNGRYNTAVRLENEGMYQYADEVLPKMIMPQHISSQPEVAAHLLKMMKGTSPQGAADALRARAERIDYLTEVLPKITVPVLIIVGREDQFTPVAKADEMKAALKNCKLVIIEEAGHLTNMEQPEEFNKEVLHFLAAV